MAEGFRKTVRGRAFQRRKEHRPFAFSLKKAQVTLETYAPNIWEELHGLADGLEVPFERAVAEFSNGRLRYPARGCSAVMTGGLYGRNYDFSIRSYDRILAAIQPQGVNASIGFSDRFTGRDDGMNEHGLCVGLHYVNEKTWQPGLACILIVRIILDQCATTREAIELLRRMPHGLSFNYSLIDTSGDAAVVEASPTAVAVREGPQLACTNHFQSPELDVYNRRNPGSHRRLPPLEAWAHEQPAAEKLFELLNSSRSPVFDHGYTEGAGTLHTLVCIPSTREMLVGIGGDVSPVRINVGDWSKGSAIHVGKLEGQLGGTLKPFDPKRRVRAKPTNLSGGSEKVFVGTNLADAAFKNLTLKNAKFDNINLEGASFDDINFADVIITENCNFSGMLIAGVSVEELFAAYKHHRSEKGS
jgi:predicted choloylglycine hydrolase